MSSLYHDAINSLQVPSFCLQWNHVASPLYTNWIRKWNGEKYTYWSKVQPKILTLKTLQTKLMQGVCPLGKANNGGASVKRRQNGGRQHI